MKTITSPLQFQCDCNFDPVDTFHIHYTSTMCILPLLLSGFTNWVFLTLLKLFLDSSLKPNLTQISIDGPALIPKTHRFYRCMHHFQAYCIHFHSICQCSLIHINVISKSVNSFSTGHMWLLALLFKEQLFGMYQTSWMHARYSDLVYILGDGVNIRLFCCQSDHAQSACHLESCGLRYGASTSSPADCRSFYKSQRA